jgi:hypothetical protein
VMIKMKEAKKQLIKINVITMFLHFIKMKKG